MDLEDLMVPAPRSLGYQFNKWSITDIRMVVVLLAFLLLVGLEVGVLGFLPVLFLAGWLLWPCEWGKRYYSYGEWLYGIWIRAVLQDILWQDVKKLDTELGRLSKPPKRSRFRRRDPFPLRVDRAHDIGMVWNKRRKTYSLLISADGSDISSMSLVDQRQRQDMIAEAIRRIASYQGLRAEVGFTFRRRPYSVHKIDTSFHNRGNPEAFVPAAAVAAAKTGKTVEALHADGKITDRELRYNRFHMLQRGQRAVAQELGGDVDMVAVVTIARSARLRAAASGKKPLSLKDVYGEKVYQIARELIEGLELASVHEPAIMDPSACEDYIRGAWDSDIGAYRASRLSTDWKPTGPDEIPAEHPQYSIRVTDKLCVMDDTGIAVVQVIKQPEALEPNLVPILAIHPRVRLLSRSLVSETSNGNVDYFLAGFMASIWDNFLDGITVRTGPRTERRREALGEEQRRIDAQQHVMYSNSFEAVISPDPEEVEAAVEDLIRVINQWGGRAKRIKGRNRQVRYALMATTGIPC
jgi:hypothetical protein